MPVSVSVPVSVSHSVSVCEDEDTPLEAGKVERLMQQVRQWQ